MEEDMKLMDRPGFTAKALKESPEDYIYYEWPPHLIFKKHEKGLLRPDGKPGFNTPTGKVELYNTILERMGYDPLPIYKEPPETAVSRPDLAKEYPLICNTGTKPVLFIHSQFWDLPWIKEIYGEPWAEIHPETAEKYGVKDGEMMVVESPRASIKIKAKVTEAVMPGVCFMPHGMWKPDYNTLPFASPKDPVVGAYEIRTFLCKIKKPEGE